MLQRKVNMKTPKYWKKKKLCLGVAASVDIGFLRGMWTDKSETEKKE